jgi:hypothetical protein
MSGIVFSVLTFTAAAGFQLAPSNRPYSVSPDLREVANIRAFSKVHQLSKAQKSALVKNLFLTCPSNDEALYWVYGRNDYQNLPSIVTSDNVLQIYHVFFEAALRNVEEQKLHPELQRLSADLFAQARERYQSLRGSPLAPAALKNVAYFGVAASLVGGAPSVPSEAKGMVDRELAAIRSHRGFAMSAIFPYDLDYSQFIVRGHYTKKPILGEYFKAMMWYGLVPFAVERGQSGNFEVLKEQAIQSLLVARDLTDSKSFETWKRIYQVTAIFAGESNNLTPSEWIAAADKVFGKGARVAEYANDAKLEAFVAAVKAMRQPPIVLKHRNPSGEVAGPAQLRFMGQRAIPDSRILQELSDPDRRPFPSPLDVMAVLGSARAAQILDSNRSVYNPKGWQGYGNARDALAASFELLPPTTWKRNLYWSWLDCLRTVVAPLPKGYPSFMLKSAWTDKALNSALASWAELRHDTILYGMQSVAEMGGDDEVPPFVKGYVEPHVALYHRLAALVRQTRDALKSRGYLVPEVAEQFASFEELLAFLTAVSQTELRNGALTRTQHQRIRSIEGELESLHNTIQVIQANYQQLSWDDKDIALVADVHTAFGEALTVGIGRADHLVAFVPIEGKLYLAKGSAFSYYEFKQPISNRLTDKAWKDRLNAGKAPPRPHWVSSFHVPQRLKEE